MTTKKKAPRPLVDFDGDKTDAHLGMPEMRYLPGAAWSLKAFGNKPITPEAFVAKFPELVLVHNHVVHGPRTRQGNRGFRGWLQERTDAIEPCACGWRPELGPHYRVKEGLGLPRLTFSVPAFDQRRL